MRRKGRMNSTTQTLVEVVRGKGLRLVGVEGEVTSHAPISPLVSQDCFEYFVVFVEDQQRRQLVVSPPQPSDEPFQQPRAP
jgi:hypothetical protein